ncbi:CMRF35-like molecule 1 [Tachysurus vachellii]|uniref:CMRF35-like molecule 1 n=1 Tax=Tachysurus vachellii TaxID=175792 RepID=UPI00296AEC85|nr:CMRF35-like molecule 1 [Tachysurus vachellii]
MWHRDSRYSVEDNKENREFTVTIRNLSVEDAGLYWCGVKQAKENYRLEVNLDVVQDVVQDVTTENATITRLRSTEPQDQETYSRDESVDLGLYLGAVLLLCGIMSAVFVIIKFNKAKEASTQHGNDTEPDVECGQGHSDESTYLAPAQSPDCIYAAPKPSQNRTHTLPSHLKPAASQSFSGENQVQHPEAVVYSAILRSGNCPRPQSCAPIFTSTRPVSYLEQRSHVLNHTPAISQESCDVYATIKRQ